MRHLRIMSSVAVLTAAMTAGPTAQAGYGSWGGSYGSSGGGVDVAYGSSGGSAGGLGSSGGFAASGGSVGGGGKRGHRLGGLFQRLAHHRTARAAHGSSGGGFAGYGSSGGFASHGGYASYASGGGGASHGSSGGGASYGSSGGFVGHGSSGAVAVHKAYAVAPAVYGGGSGGSSGGYSVPTYHYPAPVVPAYPQPAYPQPAYPRDGSEPAAAEIGDDSVLMTVSVPETALVHVNGLPTTSTGPIRQFMSKGLKEGFLYKYEVEVLYEGATEPERRTVKLRAGATERLVFHAPEATTVAEASQDESQKPLETVVTVRVPADATVVLAGNETQGQGEVRTFRSRRLVDGQRWDGYTIRVTATVNGSVVSKERTLDLVAGQTHDVSFEFDAAKVASR